MSNETASKEGCGVVVWVLVHNSIVASALRSKLVAVSVTVVRGIVVVMVSVGEMVEVIVSVMVLGQMGVKVSVIVLGSKVEVTVSVIVIG